MAVYLVSYDLRQPGRNYQPLWDALTKAGAVRLLQSAWWLETSQTAIQVRDAMMSFVDQNDGVIVVEVTENAEWAYQKLLPGAGEWIKARRR